MAEGLIEPDPSDITLRVLSDIHDLRTRGGELCAQIKNFQANRTGFTGTELMRMLQQANLVIKEQGNMLANLVEAQLELDDRLKKMVSIMETPTEG